MIVGVTNPYQVKVDYHSNTRIYHNQCVRTAVQLHLPSATPTLPTQLHLPHQPRQPGISTPSPHHLNLLASNLRTVPTSCPPFYLTRLYPLHHNFQPDPPTPLPRLPPTTMDQHQHKSPQDPSSKTQTPPTPQDKPNTSQDPLLQL